MKTTSLKAAARATAVLLLAAAPLAACGSDDDADGGSSDANGGDPIKLMVYGPFDAQGFSFPSLKTAAEAGVDKVNDEGGINGRQIELITCNDNNDPNTAAACGRQAAQEGVVAAFGLTTMEPSLIPAFESSGIPIVGNLPVTNFTSEVTYPFVGGGAGTEFGIGKLMATKPECNGKVGVVQEEFGATDSVVGLLRLAVEASGGTVGQIGKAPQGSADFAPAVAAAADDSNCLVAVVAPQTSPQILSAIAQNPKVEFAGSSDSQVPLPVIAALGAAADGLLVTNEFLPLNDSSADNEAISEMLERGRAIQDDFDAEAASASAYLAPQVIKAALQEAGIEEVTTESVVEALDQLSGFDTGMGPVLDFTEENPTKAFSRLQPNATLFTWVARGGVYVLDESVEPIELADIYEAAAAAGQ